MDRTIAYTVVGRIWTVIAGPLTLLLIARSLSGEEQGFYFTFASVLGLYVFFELGLSFVLFQFASHEMAHLRWTDEGTIEGEEEPKSRLFSLVRKAVLWYACLAALVLAILIPTGLAFFGSYGHNGAHKAVSWHFARIWVVIVTAADLSDCPIVAVLEGSGLFTEVALVRSGQMIVGGLLTWAVLLAHGRLLAAPVSNTVVVIGWWGWILLRRRPFLRQVWSYARLSYAIDWRKEIWPFQWRVAISGMSSYFIYLLFTPVLFRYQGATVAGQMGMSAAVVGAISLISISWVSTKMSPFGTLIAQGDFRRLDELFFASLWRSLGVFVALAAMFLLAAHGLEVLHNPISRRILPMAPLFLLLLTSFVNHVVGALALYLRAHKQEPFLALSVVVAALTAASTLLLAKFYGVEAMVAGNFLVTFLFSFGWGTYIFVRKRTEWHTDAAALPTTA